MLQNKSLRIHEIFDDKNDLEKLILNEFSNDEHLILLLAKFNDNKNQLIINNNLFKNNQQINLDTTSKNKNLIINPKNSIISDIIKQNNTVLINSSDFLNELSFNNQINTADQLSNILHENLIISPVLKNEQVKFILFFSSNNLKSNHIPYIKNFSQYLSITLNQSENYKQKELTDAIKDREILIQEIHHRVKNNLQIIVSLIDLQADAIKKNPEYLDDIKNRIQLMSILHDKLYHTSNFNEIYLKNYVKGIVNNINKTFNYYNNNINIKVKSDDVIISFQKAITCGLILNELIHNSLKHAFPNDRVGNIEIIIKLINEKVQIIVSDDGIGLPKNIDYKKSKTLGLQLINMLICQLKGEISISQKNGTTFKMIFKK